MLFVRHHDGPWGGSAECWHRSLLPNGRKHTGTRLKQSLGRRREEGGGRMGDKQACSEWVSLQL